MSQSVLPTLKRGWCPHLFAPMESADGFLVRIKPFPEGVSAQQLSYIGQAALKYGNGLLDITQRGNLQIRGLTQESAHVFAQEIVEHRLASTHPLTEKRRNIMVSPFAGIDPRCHPQTLAVAMDLNAKLQKAHELSPLSGKFSFIVDGGGQYGLGEFVADICLRASENQWWIGIGQSPFYTPTTHEQAAHHALALARAALSLQIRALHSEDPTALFKWAGLPVYEKDFPYSALKTPPLGLLTSMIHPTWGATVAYGALHADQLMQIAELAKDPTQPCFRFTPWRSVIMIGAEFTAAKIATLKDFITSVEDNRLHIQTCPGAPACFRGTTAVRADADYLAHHLPLREILHVSGCPKGCAYPHPTSITLTARNGRYDLIRHGRADDIPLKKGMTLAEVITLFSACKELEEQL